MANLIATSTWDAVYQLETTDQAIGGVNGTMNKQAQALNNRTQYLYDQVNTKISVEDLKTNLNAVGTAPMFVSRAWVNFNGTGTVAIRASGNVSSITDLGVGYYQMNFTAAMPDANFAVSGFCTYPASTATAGLVSYGNDYTQVTTNAQIKTSNSTSGSVLDPAHVHVTISR